MQPKISIIIPAYNASNYLAQAIDSALAQTYQNIEIVVVNDGSPDNGATREVALSYGDKIRYFEKENGGSSSAINRGIQEMTGDWFSWLSHDDLYHPEKLQRQVEFLASLQLSEEEVLQHVFFTSYELIDANVRIIKQADKKADRKMFETIEALSSNEYLIAQPAKHIFHGCSCLIHRTVFENIGAFDESFRLVNDVEFWFRLYMAGYKIHVLPEPLVYGRVHAKQVSRSIGFSYHNPEQDVVWKRNLTWLKDHYPDRYELFYLYGRDAYKKTRNAEGDEAFAYALTLNPSKKAELMCKKAMYKLYASLRTAAKQLYIYFKM